MVMRCACNVLRLLRATTGVPSASRQAFFYCLSGKKLFIFAIPGATRGPPVLAIELVPGMQLFIPSHWWHRVLTSGGEFVDISIGGVMTKK